ncbi:MAG TPA: L,D-transpeptidase family protein [Longimicrobiales bacterium]|nr:L,D-transpeptidase family protein [Longimicrobiales bacterium]
MVRSEARFVLLFAVAGAISAQSAFAQMRLTNAAANAAANAVADLSEMTLAAVTLPTDSSLRKSLTSVPTPGPGPKATAVETGFARSQLLNSRVLAARTAKKMELKQLFRSRGLDYPAAEIYLRAFKRESEMELWVRPQGADTFVLLKSYDVCALSEKPGPKRNKGDYQTPEGFYFIDDFNPQSSYHLSLRVNYPNESDKILGSTKTKALGGDIFIHGNCKTAGCLAVTDENIKEIYWLAVEARDHGQSRIPVHIFPARLSNNNLAQFENVFGKTNPELIGFWTNLKRGYDMFEQTHKLTQVSVNKFGRYVFGDPAEQLLGKPTTVDVVAQH